MMFDDVVLYAAEAEFHRKINQIGKITDALMASVIASRIYHEVYFHNPHGTSSSIFWNDKYDGGYITNFKHYIGLYKRLKINTELGITFNEFINLPREEMIAIVEVLEK